MGAIAGVCSFCGFLPYWWAIWQGKTRPNRATWWIWLIVGLIIAFSYRAAGAGSTMWVPITYVIGPLVTCLLAIKLGEGGWTKFDRICLLSTGVSLVGWAILKSPEITLIINLVIDLLGALPTIRKSRQDPYSEDLFAWLIFGVANTFNVLAIDRWIWQVAVYPIYMFVLTNAICWLLWQGRRKQRNSI